MLGTKDYKLYSHFICSLLSQIVYCLKQYQFQQLTIPCNNLHPVISVIVQFKTLGLKERKENSACIFIA